MATPQDTEFQKYAGQLIKSGIGENLPFANLEEGILKTNLAKIHGLMPKIKDTFIHDVRVFNNPLDPYIRKMSSRFGAGIEQAAFKGGAPNAKLDGTCMPWGDVDMSSQVNLANFAYDVDISIRDHEVDRAVMDEAQLGAYVAAKMRTPLQTIALLKYRSWIQLLSDVIDGTRNITSYSNSNNPASAAVTYNPTVEGYCSSIDDTGFVIPAVERGKLATVPDATTALDIAQRLEGMAADFSYSGNDLNKLEVETFATGKPLLVMETKQLNALDAVFANTNAAGTASGYGYAGFPTKTFRDYVNRFSDIVEIDSFAALPTNPTYTNKRLGAVMMDRDMLLESVQYADVESFRCTKERATGYSHQGSSTLAIWQGLDAHAMLFNTQG